MSGTHLILFSRYPSIGEVKTRLAEATNDAFAYEVFRILAKQIFNEAVLSKAYAGLHVFSAVPGETVSFNEWLGSGFEYHTQRGSDIGQRMKNAMADLFNNGADGVVLVGTDLPMLDSTILDSAAHALLDFDACLGPAADGGYYAIGLRTMNPDVFADIPWSTEKVFEATQSKLDKRNLTCMVLPTLLDIDTVHDLSDWLTNSAGLRHPLRHYLKENGGVRRFLHSSNTKEPL